MSIPVEKTLEEVRTDIYGDVNEVQDEYASQGFLPVRLNLNKGVVRGIIEIFSRGIHQVYTFLASILSQAFPFGSTDEWLDMHCAQVDVTRKPASKALGVVYFMRAGSTGNVAIAAGRVMRTLTDGQGNVYRFVTTEDVVLPDGATEVSAAAEAEEYGQASNVSAGQISEIVTTIPGVDSVENRTDWLTSEGADKEDNNSLEYRYELKWKSNNGVTKYAYEEWALDVTGVVAAKIGDNHPRGQGTVDVVVKGTAGVPTQALIDSVDAAVAQEIPINDDVLVKGPTPVTVDIDAELELIYGDPAGIIAGAEERIDALFIKSSVIEDIDEIKIGEDLTLDRLRFVLMAIPGVKKINWTAPAADTQIAEDGLAVRGTLNITTVWATEE